MPVFSTIIKNASVFDGSGAIPRKSDVGVEGDKISYIGDLSRFEAPEIVDASGLCLAPGFIDITCHSDTHWTLFGVPSQESLLRQGVTTILGGNCGSSLAPISKPSDIELLQKWTDSPDINVNWQNLKEFFEELERHRLTLNFGTLIGHGTLRRVSGTDISRASSYEDTKKMLYLLRLSLEDGAMGVSTSLGRSHSLSADDEELARLLTEVKEHGGLASHHLQDEGVDMIGAVSRIIGLARRTGVKTHISHFKVLGRKSWSKQKVVLEIIERARADGLEITLDFFPYTATGSNLRLLLPEWVIEGDDRAILRRLSDQEEKKQVISALKELTLHYEKIIVASTLKDTGAVGKSLEKIAEDAGLGPEEAAIDLLSANDLQVAIFNEAISDNNLMELASKDYAAVSSDGFGLDLGGSKRNLPHPRSFGAFTRAFKLLVKEKKIISWEEAVRRMTSLPAKIIGLDNRGLIQSGFFADMVLFDPETIEDAADYTKPRRFSSGVRRVYVNGLAALVDGELTGKMPGKVLTRF